MSAAGNIEKKRKKESKRNTRNCSVVVGAVPEGGPQMAQTLNEIKVLLQVHSLMNIYISNN